MHILYVEDDNQMAKIIGGLLSKAEHSFDTVSYGEEAVQRARSNAYDLILLDIMLPDIDGYEVIRRLRDGGNDTPFLMQTGLVDARKHGDADSLGVTEFLIKPFNGDDLTASIKNVIDRKSKSALEPAATDARHGAARDIETDDRRDHRRFKNPQTARVDSLVPFDCEIVNISYGGAALRMPDPAPELPASFCLALESGAKMRCEVRWRLGDKAGVKFA